MSVGEDTRMKAVYFATHGGLDVLRYGDVPEPVLAPGHVIVRVAASACNPGDLWARQGFPGMPIALPHIPGSDAAGVVEAVAPGVTGLAPGDAVVVHPGLACRQCPDCLADREFFCRDFAIFGQRTGPWSGAHAEKICVPAVNCLPKPAGLDFDEAAALPVVLTTVWRQLVVRGGLKPGDTVLVWGGAGGMGSVAIQLCKAFGAAAIAVGSDDAKLAAAQTLGAAHLVNRKREDVLAAVKRITDKRGVDIVFEHVGKQTWPVSVLAAKRGGVITVSGATSGAEAVTDLRYVFVRHLSIFGSNLGSVSDLRAALAFVAQGRIKPVIHSRLPLAAHAEAQRLLAAGEVVGKIVHPR
jgi:NADPH:quinone reductase-like Zn-dependent oxidoreductase